jgi:hypothetical protein
MGTVDAGRPGRFVVLGLLTAMLLMGLPGPVDRAVATPEVGGPVAPRSNHLSDFDGDGYADLAVSAEIWPDGDVNAYPGVVFVLYGSDRGLTRTRMQRWTAADFLAGDQDELFGNALAVGDFDGDGHSDLAVGSAELPLADVAQANGGRVRIVYGSSAGLTRERSQLWSQDTPGVRGTTEGEDGFGSVLVTADFGRGDQDDLAIGVGGENGSTGAVAVLYGSTTGLATGGNQLWTQASPGVPGRRSAGQEGFGLSLAAARFAGGAYVDLAVGVPGDRVGGRDDAGSVNVLRGSTAGLTSQGAQLWNQRTAGIKGSAEQGDAFGSSLAAGHFSGRRSADLAVGVSGENGDHGAVNVIYGAPRGLTAKGDQIWSRRTKGLGDRRRLDSDLGLALITGNFGHDYHGRRYDDLIATAFDAKNTNLVEIIYGSAGGLSTKHSRGWDLDSPGIQGEMSPNGTRFGTALAAGRFDGREHDDLVIGDDAYNEGLFVVVNGSFSGLTAARNRLWTADDFRQPGLTYLGKALASG